MASRPNPIPEDPAIAQVAAQLSAAGQSIDILALTSDAELLAILREAVGGSRRVLDARTSEQVGELMMAGKVGVVVVDTLATGDDSAAFCEQLRSQFPDLVLIVAGTTDDQTQLIKQITAGDIYRFLHKPVSPPRARQFLEAGIRRHMEGRTFTPADMAPPPRRGLMPAIFVLIALVIIGATAAAYYFLREKPPESASRPAEQAATSAPAPSELRTASSPTAPAANETTTAPAQAPAPEPTPVKPTTQRPKPADDRSATLAAAAAAFGAGRLIAPPGNNALELYRRVLTARPGDPEAEAGLDKIADQLLTSAETAMLEERVDDAARAIEDARTVRPNNMRLAFLSAQLGKERERRLIALARQAAESGNFARAEGYLDRAAQDQKTVSPLLAQARRELAQHRVGTNADNLLKKANERLQNGKLIAPEGDSAETFILAALAADPKNVTAQQARRTLADQTVARARQAVDAGDFAAAEQWLKHADSLGANVRGMQRDLDKARQTNTRSEQQTQLAARLDERIAQGRLSTPERDNAVYYWRELRAADPQNARLQPALQSIGAGLLQQSQASLGKGDVVAAQAAVDQAKALGFSSAALTAFESQIAATRERGLFMANVIDAATLARDKYVAPRYPVAAQNRGTTGWVELEFTVGADGAVKDAMVFRADPAGTFDDAALKAVSQWRYRPIVRNGQAVEQRARLRMRFMLDKS
ncbi:MAG TPA: TonB family protein [Steroidobacteraceae bacterium]|nr:TonB family protein [Steroidobacteraceae bacterium]